MNRMLGQTKGELEKIIKNVGDDYEVVYNKDRLQSKSEGVSTCGRWTCGYLSMFKMGYPLEEFLRIVNEQCKSTGLAPDVLICKWIPVFKK